jgi:hypothetical protein
VGGGNTGAISQTFTITSGGVLLQDLLFYTLDVGRYINAGEIFISGVYTVPATGFYLISFKYVLTAWNTVGAGWASNYNQFIQLLDDMGTVYVNVPMPITSSGPAPSVSTGAFAPFPLSWSGTLKLTMGRLIRLRVSMVGDTGCNLTLQNLGSTAGFNQGLWCNLTIVHL